MKVQNNSWCRNKSLLRVAASSNLSFHLTLRDEAAQRPVVLNVETTPLNETFVEAGNTLVAE